MKIHYQFITFFLFMISPAKAPISQAAVERLSALVLKQKQIMPVETVLYLMNLSNAIPTINWDLYSPYTPEELRKILFFKDSFSHERCDAFTKRMGLGSKWKNMPNWLGCSVETMFMQLDQYKSNQYQDKLRKFLHENVDKKPLYCEVLLSGFVQPFLINSVFSIISSRYKNESENYNIFFKPITNANCGITLDNIQPLIEKSFLYNFSNPSVPPLPNSFLEDIIKFFSDQKNESEGIENNQIQEKRLEGGISDDLMQQQQLSKDLVQQKKKKIKQSNSQENLEKEKKYNSQEE